MKLLSGLPLLTVATDFVKVNRLTAVDGIACPTSDTKETTNAVKAAFNLDKVLFLDKKRLI